MIKVFVFDTNSLISAHLLPKSVNRKAYDRALQRGVIARSAETFSEFTEVFTRQKFGNYISLEARLEALNAFEETTSVNICRDPKDDKFLSLAKAVSADCIVSGDKDLLVLSPFEDIPVLNAAQFINKF